MFLISSQAERGCYTIWGSEGCLSLIESSNPHPEMPGELLPPSPALPGPQAPQLHPSPSRATPCSRTALPLLTSDNSAWEVQSAPHLVFLFYELATTKCNFGNALTFLSHTPECSCARLPLAPAFVSLGTAEIIQIRPTRQGRAARDWCSTDFKRSHTE